ncbi:hypothetical protein [Photobacterium indicum]|uniref:hypothetical protein n=1 Tax=Photobacterium indicum TaxID=81447 RepID=UPI003D105CF2
MLKHRRNETENYRYWSNAEVHQLKLLAEDHSAREIAPIMGRSLRSVKQALLSRGIKIMKRPRFPFSSVNDAFIRKNIGTLTHEQIAQHLGKTKLAISHRVIRLGLTHTYLPVYQTIHSEEDVDLCRDLSDAGVTMVDIAEKMEIPYRTVINIVHYKSRRCALPRCIYRFDDSA